MTPPKNQEEIAKSLADTIKALFDMLRGAGYEKSLLALGFFIEYHQGYRKDGLTPSVMHQLRIAFSILNKAAMLKEAGLDPDRAIADGLLHDTIEDNKTLQIDTLRHIFGDDIVGDLIILDKVPNGKALSREAYFRNVFNNPYTTIVKIEDRLNNGETSFALPPEKQPEFDAETIILLAEAKAAIYRFPKLSNYIQLVRTSIKQTVKARRGFLAAIQTNPAQLQEILAAYKNAGVDITAPYRSPEELSLSGNLARRALGLPVNGKN